ncbi:MAG: TrkH family potassium uptake protein, partial [Clostridia bacterium]|nr:TrkH family potassium uptake protein [Clostridia bacterium]
MNRRMVVFLLSRILLIEALLMLPSFAVGLIYGETGTAALCFLPVMGVLLLLGLIGLKKPKNTAIYAREGFLTVAGAWVLMSLFGALPFLFGGVFTSYIDAVFETASGFTTTGATVCLDISGIPHGIGFWRC